MPQLPTKKPERIYYARSIALMNTAEDARNIAAIQAKYPNAKIDIVDPKTCGHLRGKRNKMTALLRRVSRATQVVVAESEPKHVSAGVYCEARHAQNEGKRVELVRNGKLKTVNDMQIVKNADWSGKWARLKL